MKRLALVLLIVLAACGDDASTTTTTSPGFAVSGYAHAGPQCPVETTPPDPACADRPVVGAMIRFVDAAGVVVAEAITATDGTFTLELPAGDYTLVAQPVEGIVGTPPPVDVTVAGPVEGIDLAYDTGIR